jgi:DNA-binding IclR family transcriptional regulator
VNITILSGHEALYVDQVAGSAALQLHNWVGQRIPLHATSNGKVLLSSVSGVRFDELTSGVLKRFTDKTVTEHLTLRTQIEEVRRQGYAVAVDELEVGLTAIAAPISGADGVVVGSISASGPGFRITADRVPDVAAQVMAAAGEVSRRLGWHGQ